MDSVTFQTSLRRALQALAVGALVGPMLVGLGFATVAFDEFVLSGHPGGLYRLPSFAFGFAMISAPFYALGLALIGMPMWLMLHAMGFRHWSTAFILGYASNFSVLFVRFDELSLGAAAWIALLSGGFTFLTMWHVAYRRLVVG